MLLVAALASAVTGIVVTLQGEEVDEHGSAEGAYTVISGSIDAPLRTRLGKDWLSYRSNLQEPEHAYCITRYTTRKMGDSLRVEIHEVMQAPTTYADPVSVSYSCGEFPTLHTHPPSSCVKNGSSWNCFPYENSDETCQPSQGDIASTQTDRHRFGVVQCGIDRFVFFAPT